MRTVLSLACLILMALMMFLNSVILVNTTEQHHTRINWLVAHPEHGLRVLQLQDNDAVDRYIDGEIAKEKP